MNADFSYRAPRGPGAARRRLLFATILILVVFILDIFSGGKIRGAVRNAEVSVWSVGVRAWDSVAHNGFFASRASLEAENASLSGEIAQYEERAAAYDTLSSENAALGQMVHLAQTSPGITAPIVSSFNASPYGTFLVGAGSADNVATGDLVLTDADFVIGRVADVSARTSLVDELFAPNASVNVVIDGADVPAQGEGGGNAQARIPRGVNVNAGDSVIAPEYGGRAVGVVGHVISDPANGYSQVYISLPVDLSALRFVYITQ